MLSRDAILAMDDLVKEAVFIPEWNLTVYVRTMTGTELDQFDASLVNDSNPESNLRNLRARLAVLTVCDEQGIALFRWQDTEALGQKSAAALDRIYEVAKRLNRIGDKAKEELAGNSDAAQGGDSGSN